MPAFVVPYSLIKLKYLGYDNSKVTPVQRFEDLSFENFFGMSNQVVLQVFGSLKTRKLSVQRPSGATPNVNISCPFQYIRRRGTHLSPSKNCID